MTSLDSNILVRYLVQDDMAQDSHLPIMTFDKRASRLTSFELLK